MRIRLTLEPINQNTSISFNYHYAFSSMIYNALRRSSAEYADFLHNQGYQSGQKRFKHFTFSRPWIEKQQIRNGRIYIVSGPILWQISSPIDDFLNNIVNGLFAERIITLSDDHSTNQFQLRQIETLAPPEYQETMSFTCLAPLMVSIKDERDGQPHKHYVRPDDDSFAELIKRNLLEKYRVLYDCEPQNGDFEFAFDWDFINRRGGVERISKLIKYKDINIRGFVAPFKVKGSAELIKLGYECGFGGANSQGFGMAASVSVQDKI
jgi:CRISPR-associated endoribonuclease Cas6